MVDALFQSFVKIILGIDAIITLLGQRFSIRMSWFKKKDVFPHTNEDGTVELDESCFDDFIKSNPKVMVMFYRTTCSHSVNMIPVFAELCNDLKEKMKFCRVSTPTNMPLVKKYEVKNTPTFVILINGKVSASIVGEKTKDFLRGEIERSFAQ